MPSDHSAQSHHPSRSDLSAQSSRPDHSTQSARSDLSAQSAHSHHPAHSDHADPSDYSAASACPARSDHSAPAAPPWHFLNRASARSLQSFELSRLNHAANLRAEIVTLIDQWVQEAASALLARWLLDSRPPLVPAAVRAASPRPTLLRGG